MNIFNKIPLLRPKRNTFNLGYENRMSTDLFRLTPFFLKEALPDDVFKLRAEMFARVMPALNAPVMQRFNIRYYYFFVPTRIIWDDFEKWINPKSGVSDIVAPRIKFHESFINSTYSDGIGPKTLADYLGLNFGIAPEDQGSPSAFRESLLKIFTNSDSVVKPFEVSSLPFRAYQQVYNDWFIDLNNTDIAEFSKGSGVEELKASDFQPGDVPYNAPLYQALLKIRNRAWEHDYFTSALPDPQRGPDVMAFDGTGESTLEVSGTGTSDVEVKQDTFGYTWTKETGEPLAIPYNVQTGSAAATGYTLSSIISQFYAELGYASASDAESALTERVGGVRVWKPGVVIRGGQSAIQRASNVGSDVPSMTYAKTWIITGANGAKIVVGQSDDVVRGEAGKTVGMANVSDIASKLSVSSPDPVSGVTVEELRVRMQMQSFLERNNVGGSRYTEMLYAHWGVKDPDGRLQRSEFLGGGKQPLMINEVSQTSAPSDEDPLGQYAGQGTSSGMGRTIKFRAPEHGFVIGLMCIMPRTGYFQGIEKYWNRFDRLDYYWPSFAHLGEQEIKNSEILFSVHDPDGTFGYQQRYAEYKASYDQVHGDMKGNLSFWHGARAFATPDTEDDIPKLSVEFTTPSEPGQDGIDRIFPVLANTVPTYNADHFVVDIYNHCVASRRMPKFVTPRNGA